MRPLRVVCCVSVVSSGSCQVSTSAKLNRSPYFLGQFGGYAFFMFVTINKINHLFVRVVGTRTTSFVQSPISRDIST